MKLTRQQHHTYAHIGAGLRLTELDTERARILAAFPDLAPRMTAPIPAPSSNGRAPMSEARRRAIGRRMRAYWAKRRAGKGQ